MKSSLETCFFHVHTIPSPTDKQSYYLFLSQCVSKEKDKTFALYRQSEFGMFSKMEFTSTLIYMPGKNRRFQQ